MPINELIATQYSRNPIDSPIDRLSRLEDAKGRGLTNEINTEVLTANKFSNMKNQSDFATSKQQRGLEFAANIGAQLRRETDPVKKSRDYQGALKIAEMNGHDVSMYPKEYDETAQTYLDVAYAQLYEPELLKQKLSTVRQPNARIDLIEKLTEGMSPEEKLRAHRIELELEAPARTFAPHYFKYGDVNAVSTPQNPTQANVITVPGINATTQPEIQSVLSGQEADKQGGITTAKLESELELAPQIEGEKAKAVQNEKIEADRRGEIIDAGLTAKSQIPRIEQLIEINKKLATGGIQSVVEQGKRLFGREAADVGAFKAEVGAMLLSIAAALKPVSNDERVFLSEEVLPSLKSGQGANDAMINRILQIAKNDYQKALILKDNPSMRTEDLLSGSANQSQEKPASKTSFDQYLRYKNAAN